MQVESIDARDRGVNAVKADNRESLIVGPNAALETAFPGFRQRCDVEHHATNSAQEFAPHKIKLIVLAIESVRININHLQETFRYVGRSEQAAHMRKRIERIKLSFSRVQHRVVH